jgi:hypothetical protein
MADEEQTGEVPEEEILSEDLIEAFVVAAHGNLPRVRMLILHPGLLNARITGPRPIQRPHPGRGAGPAACPWWNTCWSTAPLITTAAMLGRKADVERMLNEDPRAIDARGAHGIPLMPHAAMSGNVELAKMLYERGATTSTSHALSNAVMHGDARMARWLLENAKPDLSWKSYEGKGSSP